MGLSYMLLGFLGAPSLAWIGRRTGKRAAMFYALGIALFAFGGNWFWYSPRFPWLQLVGSGAGAFGSAGISMIVGSMVADVMDYDELGTGKRREGAFSACNSWINKAGGAAGYFIAGQILNVIGFHAGSVGPQSAHTLALLRAAVIAGPILGIGLGAFLLLRFPLTQESMHAIRLELEARRGKI